MDLRLSTVCYEWYLDEFSLGFRRGFDSRGSLSGVSAAGQARFPWSGALVGSRLLAFGYESYSDQFSLGFRRAFDSGSSLLDISVAGQAHQCWWLG